MRTLCGHALEGTDVEAMQAESFYHLARVCHIEEDYDAALKNYYQATKLAPKYVLPQFGLGQMYIHKGEMHKVVVCL